MRLLLTGAAGFAGSHALRHFLANTDWTIVCPVTTDHKGHLTRLQSATKGFDDKRVVVVPCDLTQPLSTHTKYLFGDVDYIINYASESHVDRSISDPVTFVRNNVDLMLTVLEFAREQENLRCLIHVSTDEVHGPALPGEAHTEWDAIIPSNPYAASKAAQEAILVSYWRTYGLPVVLTNSMNFIGEYQDSEKFLPMMIKNIRAGKSVPIHSGPDGEPGSRMWIHARNLADAMLWILKQDATVYTGQEQGVIQQPDRWNIVGEELDNLALAHRVARILGLPLKYHLVDFHSARPGHDSRYALDGSKIRDAGWVAPISLDTGLANIAEWREL